jgi:hypothetical protein
VTLLVWLVLIAGIVTLVRVTIEAVQGDDSAFSLFWPLLITAAAGSALWRGVDRPPPPEPDPNLGYFAWLGRWVLVHPVRTVICVYCLAVLGAMVVGGLSEL